MNCRLCLKETFFKYSLNGTNLYACLSCGFVQAEPEPTTKQLQEIYKPNYFSHSKYRDKKTLDYENKRRLDILKKYLPENTNRKVLDYGCARGEFINYAKQGYNWYGIDYSVYAIEQAKGKIPEFSEQLVAITNEHRVFTNTKFDAIVMWDVIEHIYDVSTLLNKLLNHLNPGGFLIISTPDVRANTAKIMGKHWAFMTPPEHLSFFSHKSMKYFIANNTNLRLISSKSKGKKVNLGFLIYKIQRKFPWLIPNSIIHFFSRKYTKNMAVYVPTGDILYAVIQKKN